jgi:hypothetical protein
MIERLRQIFRRRRIRFLKARAMRSARQALLHMRCMETDLHELAALSKHDVRIVPLTAAEIDAAVEGIG